MYIKKPKNFKFKSG